MKYELVFIGGGPISYTREHDTYESAEAEAAKVLDWMTEHEHAPIGASQTLTNLYGDGYPRNAHPAIIYGPGCGADGRTIGVT